MKKCAVVLLVMTLVLCAATGLAESVDLSQMTLDELITIQKRVDDEIRSRLSFSSFSMYPGTYVVGTDIKAGAYVITGGSNMEYSSVAAVFESQENLLEYVSWDSSDNLQKYSKHAAYIRANNDVYISLTDGDIFYLGAGFYTIKETVVPFQP